MARTDDSIMTTAAEQDSSSSRLEPDQGSVAADPGPVGHDSAPQVADDPPRVARAVPDTRGTDPSISTSTYSAPRAGDTGISRMGSSHATGRVSADPAADSARTDRSPAPRGNGTPRRAVQTIPGAHRPDLPISTSACSASQTSSAARSRVIGPSSAVAPIEPAGDPVAIPAPTDSAHRHRRERARLSDEAMASLGEATSTVTGAAPDPRPHISMHDILQCRQLSDVRAVDTAVSHAAHRCDREGSRCVSTVLIYDVAGRHMAQVQRELAKQLHDDLTHHRDTPAFAAGQARADPRPRADDLEGMYAAMPGKAQIDFSAPAMASPQNLPLWRRMHAMHCGKCSASGPHDDCYFRYLHHFLRAGFEPPVLPGADLSDIRKHSTAYVDLWRQYGELSAAAMTKWADQAGGFMSAPTDAVPDVVFPLLPVVRPKHEWRWLTQGIPYKARLCIDSKCGGLNDKYCDWAFRYRPIEDAISRIEPGAMLACVDIGAFFNRLPAGPALQRMQHFQDPSTYAATTATNATKKKKLYRHLRCCGFGSKLLPAFASTVSSELVRILGVHGIQIAGCMLDDILIYRNDGDAAVLNQQLRQTEQIMADLGLPSNAKTQPAATSLVYLGYLLDSTAMTISISPEHRDYAESKLGEILSGTHVSLRDLRSIAGVLTWLARVMLNGKPRRRAIFAAIAAMEAEHNAVPRASSRVPLRGPLVRQLRWWLHVLRARAYSGSRCFAPSSITSPAILLRGDASNEHGWGLCAQGYHVFGFWPAALHGTLDDNMLVKELLPPTVGILLFGPHRRTALFATASDNAGVAFVMNALRAADGPSNRLLHRIADAMVEHDLGLVCSHARRARNTHADWLSRSIPTAAWPGIERTTRRGDWNFPIIIHDTTTGAMKSATIRL